jgi:hypothetical protein
VLSNADFYLKNSGVYNGKSWAQTFIDTVGAQEKADGKKYCDGVDFHSYPYFDTTDPTAARHDADGRLHVRPDPTALRRGSPVRCLTPTAYTS